MIFTPLGNAWAYGSGYQIANNATLQKQVMMIDVFLAKEVEAGHLQVTFKSMGGDLLIHGHCHQKALSSIQYHQVRLRRCRSHEDEDRRYLFNTIRCD